MEVKENHPLGEIIAKRMFGLNNCDCIYYKKMVNKCAKEAVAYHNQELESKHKEFIESEKEMCWSKEEIQRLTLSEEDIISIIDSCSDGHKYFDKDGIVKKIINLQCGKPGNNRGTP